MITPSRSSIVIGSSSWYTTLYEGNMCTTIFPLYTR